MDEKIISANVYEAYFLAIVHWSVSNRYGQILALSLSK